MSARASAGSPSVRRAIAPGTACLLVALLTACTTGSALPEAEQGAPTAPGGPNAPGGSLDPPPPAVATDTPPTTALRFEDGTAASGIDFTHLPTYTDQRYMPEIQGGGVAIIDVNRDGAPDVLAINSGSLHTMERPAGGSSRLYLNDGRGRFTDATTEWGLEGLERGYGMGAAVGDVDGDGWPDVFLTTFGAGEKLLRNTGAGFEDITEASGIRLDPEWSNSAGMFDLENDGDLDIFVTLYAAYTLEDAVPCYTGDLQIYCTPHLVDAVPDWLLRNDGGTFIDVAEAAGLHKRIGRGLALSIGDIDLDGDQDVYVANDLSPNNLWLNMGAGIFDDIGPRAGVAMNIEGRAEAGMGADMGDIDGDGKMDLVNTNFEFETTNVHLQTEDLMFREVSDAAGVGQTARARLSWGIDLFDADNDGDEDLLVANGHIYDNAGEFAGGPTFPQQNTLYENVGAGAFVDVSDVAGPALAVRDVSRGLAIGDLDGDGDLDFLVGNNGGKLQVGINESANVGAWVGLWLEGAGAGAETAAGPGANRSAIGARVEARIGDRTLLRQVSGGSSYLSASDLRVHLGLGDADRIDELTIHWPGGGVQAVGAVEANAYYRIVQGVAPERFTPGERVFPPE